MKHVELGEPGGQPLVFLHGGNVAGWMWGPQVADFADFRVLVPDLPGFGASAAEPWQSIAATADGVAELLPGPAHVVGLSLGSSVAIELSRRHPASVRSLFLASTQALPPSRATMAAGRVMLHFWERRWFWTALARSYGLRGKDAQQLVDTGLGIRRETAIAIFEEVSRGMTVPDLPPALAVAGERDRGSVASLSALAVQRALAPGVGHQWNVEAPDLFNAALRTWLDSGAIDPRLRPFSGPE
jgi:pimeloyl-ACP methyl ester carboxylesterase